MRPGVARSHPTAARLLALALLAASIWIASSGAIAHGAFPGSNGNIAFNRIHNPSSGGISPQTGIYVMEPDGSGQTQLTACCSFFPAWSPDGTKIAFRSGGIAVMNADGSGRAQLTLDGDHPAWSPDGTKLAFSAAGIFVMNADGSGRTQLTTEGLDHQPAWSPDGTKIAFHSPVGAGLGIFVMNADGSGRRQLTPEGQTPAWSPDGTKIAFHRGVGSDNPDFEIFVMNADGSGQANLTNDSGHADLFPAWSPDGTRIAFSSAVPSEGRFRLHVMNADGSGRTRLTDPAAPPGDDIDDLHADWQPSPDRDGDALLDVWEEDGIDVDGDGTVDLDLPAMGANPDRKDVFVELDFMPPHAIEQAAVDAVVEAFRIAPVDNPDGSTGITLHVDNGPGSVMDPVTGGRWGSLWGQDALAHSDVLGSAVSGAYDWTDFDALKAVHFAEERERAFRYGISAHGHPGVGPQGAPSGESRGIPGSDFVITLGAGCQASQGGSDCTFGVKEQAGTLMHELGHNLGLSHGGADGVNFKPSYLSVMNYAFQFPWLIRATDLTEHLDYARFGFSVLEVGLDESGGFGAPAGSPAADFATVFFCPSGAQTAWPLSGPVDFDCSGGTPGGVVTVDLNRDNSTGRLTGVEDWPRLVFRGGSVGALGAPVLPQQTPLIEPPVGELLASQRAVADFVAARRAGASAPPVVAQPPTPLGAPVLKSLRVRPTAFAAARRGASIARTGARVTYRLSEAARVRFRVQRLRARRARTLRGRFRHTGRAGTNRLRFTGRLAGKRLRPGRYRLVARPATTDGRRGATRHANFKIKARNRGTS